MQKERKLLSIVVKKQKEHLGEGMGGLIEGVCLYRDRRKQDANKGLDGMD